MRIIKIEFSVPDRSGPGLTTTASGAVGQRGAGGNSAAVDRHESRDLKCSCRCSEGGLLAVGVTKDDAGIG